MPTSNPRLNVTFDEKTVSILTQLAKKQDQSISGLIKTLVLEALALHEDLGLSLLAHERDKKTKKTLTHKTAWE